MIHKRDMSLIDKRIIDRKEDSATVNFIKTAIRRVKRFLLYILDGFISIVKSLKDLDNESFHMIIKAFTSIIILKTVIYSLVGAYEAFFKSGSGGGFLTICILSIVGCTITMIVVWVHDK